MSRQGVITGGSWCVDRNLQLASWPQENSWAPVETELLCGGGPSYNMAANLKSLDPDFFCETIGFVGEDGDGRFLIDTAKALGIGTSRFQTTTEHRTDYTLAFASRDTGRRTHISSFDVADYLTPDHFDFTGTTARLAHLGLPGIHATMDAPFAGDPSGWVTVLKKARAAGLLTNMELLSMPAERIGKLIAPCLPHLDLLIVNDHEIGGLSGLATVPGDATDVGACADAARRALEAGSMDIVAVHFPLGAVIATRDGQEIRTPSVAIPPAEVAGANGAGDAFAAGFVYGWHEGWPLEDSVRLAHASAAASLRDITTTGAVESWRTCLDLANAWGWRPEL